MLLVFYITTPKKRTAADTRGLPHAIAAARFPWFPPHHSHTNRQYLPPITPYPPSLATASRFHLTVKYYPCLERNPIDWRYSHWLEGISFVDWRGVLCSLGLPWVFLGFPWFPLVSLGLPWVPLVSLVWRCTLPRNNPTPPTPSIKPETFLSIVPRGTPVQSRISRSLLLIALYICFMQYIDNKANKRTMIKSRASPVAITYRPNSNAMYPQNKVSTKYITNPIKYTISNHDFKITPK